ncbi:unnamed protein product [Leptidea sinapis]|uniref:LITAF domain-containing protein n=1 Tax=Leptidea sinapis TaxID=189913 RepID=A0A5E4QWT6_9NEOP|nr:unnamed protein product [Leptidea sinapis]
MSSSAYIEAVVTTMSTPPPKISNEPVSQVESPLLGPENTIVSCPYCHASVKTAVNCCCCIPYCSDSAKNSDHYCPNCSRYLGTYEK